MRFETKSSSLEDKAYFAICFLQEMQQKGKVDEIENIDEVLTVFEELLSDYSEKERLINAYRLA